LTPNPPVPTAGAVSRARANRRLRWKVCDRVQRLAPLLFRKRRNPGVLRVSAAMHQICIVKGPASADTRVSQKNLAEIQIAAAAAAELPQQTSASLLLSRLADLARRLKATHRPVNGLSDPKFIGKSAESDLRRVRSRRRCYRGGRFFRNLRRALAPPIGRPGWSFLWL
jgi:hypothetical protein